MLGIVAVLHYDPVLWEIPASLSIRDPALWGNPGFPRHRGPCPLGNPCFPWCWWMRLLAAPEPQLSALHPTTTPVQRSEPRLRVLLQTSMGTRHTDGLQTFRQNTQTHKIKIKHIYYTNLLSSPGPSSKFSSLCLLAIYPHPRQLLPVPSYLQHRRLQNARTQHALMKSLSLADVLLFSYSISE